MLAVNTKSQYQASERAPSSWQSKNERKGHRLSRTRRQLLDARGCLEFVIALNPRRLPSREGLETILAFLVDSASPIRRRTRLPRGQTLTRFIERLHAVLAPLADGKSSRLDFTTVRGIEVAPASGAPGGFKARLIADPADALILAVLDLLRVVGLRVLARCDRCGRVCILRRMGRYRACSPECHQGLRTARYRAAHPNHFLQLRREAYRR